MATTNRRYLVRSYPPIFACGKLSDGTQAVVGVQGSEIVGVFFDTKGAFRNLESRTNSSGRANEVESLVEEWMSQLGLEETQISIQSFFIEERWIGIRDLPAHYQDVVDTPDVFSEEDRQRLLNDANEWLSRGDFVLYWDEDYYVNADGEVESS